MGQQQLLLIVLGALIVGLATAVSVMAFGENSRTSRADRYTAQAVALAADVVTWQQKPTVFGGNGNRADVSRLSFSALGYSQTSAEGGASLEHNGVRLVLDGQEQSRPVVRVHDVPGEAGDVLVEIAVYGAEPECWVTRTRAHDGAAFAEPAAPLESPDADGCAW